MSLHRGWARRLRYQATIPIVFWQIFPRLGPFVATTPLTSGASLLILLGGPHVLILAFVFLMVLVLLFPLSSSEPIDENSFRKKLKFVDASGFQEVFWRQLIASMIFSSLIKKSNIFKMVKDLRMEFYTSRSFTFWDPFPSRWIVGSVPKAHPKYFLSQLCR